MKIVMNRSNFDCQIREEYLEMVKESSAGGKSLPLMWGIVKEVCKDTASVKVKMDNGFTLSGVRVGVMGEYVRSHKDEAKNSVYEGKKKLPFAGSRVLVAFPCDGVPVTLCSVLLMESSGDTKHLIDADPIETERTIKASGWNFSYDQEKGNIEVKDDKNPDSSKNDEDFQISLDKEKRKLSVVWWGKSIEIRLEDKGIVKVSTEDCSFTLDQQSKESSWKAGENEVSLDGNAGVFQVKDGNGNKIESSASGLKLESSCGSKLDLGSLVELSTTAGGLKSMIDDLWTEINSLAATCSTHTHPGSTSSGSPFAHAVTCVPDAGFSANTAAIQAKKAFVSTITK